MAHIDHQDHIRGALLAHRDRIQALLDCLDHKLSCAELLNSVHGCHHDLGKLCAELAIEHLQHHVAEQNEVGQRQQGANELAAVHPGCVPLRSVTNGSTFGLLSKLVPSVAKRFGYPAIQIAS
jgi:DNA-binding FrmR family transcriptional regulator